MTKQFIEKANNLSSLPSPPQIAVKVLEICQDPNKGISDLAQVLSLDSALSAKILNISNSAAYSRGREILSVSHAIAALGTNTTSIIALGFSLRTNVLKWKHSSGLTDAHLWRTSVATAVASRSLGRLVAFSDPDRAFLCGLMSRIGQLMMFTISPDDYGMVIDAAGGGLPTAEQEQFLLGITHHKIGRRVMEKWNLPRQICDVVENWNNPVNLEGDTKTLASIVHVANITSELLFDEDKAQGLQQLHDKAQDLLHVSHGEIDRQFIACQQELRETLSAFDDPTATGIDCETILETARNRLIQVSLSIASDLTVAQEHSTSLEEENRGLEKSYKTDALTGLANRAALDAELATFCKSRSQTQRPYSIFMVDIDHFKQFNDTHGHTAGDQILQGIGRTLADQARSTDFVARYGGEEFTVILTNVGKENSFNAAERYRRAIENLRIELSNTALSVTASFGVASTDHFDRTLTAKELLEFADAALYEAKRLGRNRSVACNEALAAPTNKG